MGFDDLTKNPFMAPTVEVLEGSDEDRAVGQGRGRAETKRLLERLRRSCFSLPSFSIQTSRVVQCRVIGSDEGSLLIQRR